MGQTWVSNTYQGDHTAQTDLQNMETNFATLKSTFSGTSSPSNAEAGMLWFDTNKKLLKVRNQANSAWDGVMAGTKAQSKVWFWSNVAEDGWVVDSSTTDRVLAVKGGSNAYNVSGGSNAGTWTQPNHTHTISASSAGAHVHKIRESGNSSDQVYNSSGSLVNVNYSSKNSGYGVASNRYVSGSGKDPAVSRKYDNKDWYSQSKGAHTHTGTAASNATANTYRPAAAVGTIQYMNV